MVAWHHGELHEGLWVFGDGERTPRCSLRATLPRSCLALLLLPSLQLCVPLSLQACVRVRWRLLDVEGVGRQPAVPRHGGDVQPEPEAPGRLVGGDKGTGHLAAAHHTQHAHAHRRGGRGGGRGGCVQRRGGGGGRLRGGVGGGRCMDLKRHMAAHVRRMSNQWNALNNNGRNATGAHEN